MTAVRTFALSPQPAELKLRGAIFGNDDLLTMAIVNRTPDSFYDRGATYAFEAALERVHQVVDEGAEIVDIGGVKAGTRRRGRAWRRSCAGRWRSWPPSAHAHPRTGHQRGHLAARGRGGRSARPAPISSTTPGEGGTRAWSRSLPNTARPSCARMPAACPAHPPAPDRLCRRHAMSWTGSWNWRTGPSGRGRSGQHPHRPGPRLRQEHPALAGDHPAAGPAGRAPDCRSWSPCPTRTSSARPSTSPSRSA